MKEALTKRFGEHRVSDFPVEEGKTPLLILDLELRTPVTVLMTNGLHNYRMPVPEKEEGREYIELFFCLPGYWEWEDLENPNMNWIYYWIERLSKYVQENETWYGNGHTMPCGKEKEPLSSTMKQNHFILLNPMELEQELAPIEVEGKMIHFLAIVPIFEDEFDYKYGKGTRKLVVKFINKRVTEQLDDFRTSVMKGKWRLIRN